MNILIIILLIGALITGNIIYNAPIYDEVNDRFIYKKKSNSKKNIS